MGNNFFTRVLILCAFLQCAQAKDPVSVTPPKLYSSEWLAVNLRTKIQLDFSRLRPELDEKTNVFRNRSLRFGADGTVLGYLDYVVELETRRGDPEFRDVFLKYRRLGPVQIQAGRFKIPFGLDQMTDSAEIDFVQRSRIGATLAPGRDAGMIVSGSAMNGKVQYSAGLFRHDGRNSRIEELAQIDKYRPGGNRTVAARVTVQPSRVPGNLKLGAALTRSRVTPGLSSLDGVSTFAHVFFPRMFVNGSRTRHGAEVRWQPLSLTLQGEFMDVRDQRLGQGLRGENLPDLRAKGWYVSATHPVVGRLDSPTQGSFLRSILPGTQLGLLEAAIRYETVRFGASSDGGVPSRSPRAAVVAANEDRLWTFGINWRANHYFRFQVNSTRENFRDPARTPIDGVNTYWTHTGRAQLFF